MYLLPEFMKEILTRHKKANILMAHINFILVLMAHVDFILFLLFDFDGLMLITRLHLLIRLNAKDIFLVQ